jgi:hypothetical protein
MNRTFAFFKTAFAVAAVALVLGASSQVARAQSCAAPPKNMVAWYPGDDNAEDITPFQNDGTLHGGASFAPGEVADAFKLDGSSGYVTAPDAPQINFGTGDLSVDAWIKTANGNNGRNVQAIIDKRVQNPPGTYVGYHFFIYIDGSLGFQLSGTNFISSTNVADGIFHHVAATIDRTSTTGGNLYVDGVNVLVFDPTGQSASLDNTSELQIGRNSPGTGGPNFFDGLIDEVELFNRALTATEVASIHDALSAGKCKPGTVYTVDYFANANTLGAPDGTVRIINPGTTDNPNNPTDAAALCALIYVFDANQQLSECCGCSLTANALATLSVNINLTANPLLGTKLKTGVIKIISSGSASPCDPTKITTTPTLRAWATHIQNKVGAGFPVTEGESQAARLGRGEQADLAEDCTVLEELGSGAGVCKCPPGH